ncbi:MAG TPA: WGR domain-containing protein [Kofleriaceae bacterium]|nr:WGR domain-containing protein [Kofleriaceae bacterium]
MSEWTVQLEFEEGTSSKFWRARVEGKTLYVNYGKIGANGQTQVKDLGDPAAAKAEYDKLVREKRKKGYSDIAVRRDDSGGRTKDDDDDGDGGDGDEGGDDEGDDDEDDKPAARPAKKPAKPAAAPAAAPRAAPSSPGHRLVLDAGGRKVETTVFLEGNAVRMDSRETYASPDAASKAFERLKRMLGGEGYKVQ